MMLSSILPLCYESFVTSKGLGALCFINIISGFISFCVDGVRSVLSDTHFVSCYNRMFWFLMNMVKFGNSYPFHKTAENIRITHVFSCINIRRVPRKLFGHEAVRLSVQTSSEGTGKC